MCMCWSQDANCRPTAEEIHTIASHPHFSCLLEAVKFDNNIGYITGSCVTEKAAAVDMAASMLGMLFIDTVYYSRYTFMVKNMPHLKLM